MKRALAYMLPMWPLVCVLAACSTAQQLGSAASDSGAGGEVQGSAGEGDTGGSSPQSTGGRGPGTGGAAGSGDSAQGGQGTGGAAGSGDGGQAGKGAAGSAARELLPGASSFTKLTVRSSGGMPMGSDPADECHDGYQDAWSVDRASQTLSWDFCGWPSPRVVERGRRTLSDAEFRAVVNTLSIVAPSTRDACGADKPNVTLELEVDGSSTVYTDDFYQGCDAEPEGKRYVQGLDALSGWLSWLSSGLEIPAAPETLSVSGDPLSQDPPVDSECWSHYQRRYELDVSTGDLSWDYCSTPAETGAFMVVTGNRVLDEAERESALRAYGHLEVGASGPCDSLSVPANDFGYVASVWIGEAVYLVDEGASCSDDTSGAYAIGVAALARTLDGLVR
jgi:hypothetical protein